MGVSMRDVANAASVSLGTVSNVLNSPEKVSPATVARVHAAIDKLGFARNDAARQLRAGRSRCAGLAELLRAAADESDRAPSNPVFVPELVVRRTTVAT